LIHPCLNFQQRENQKHFVITPSISKTKPKIKNTESSLLQLKKQNQNHWFITASI
jgi:hypothetical protein